MCRDEDYGYYQASFSRQNVLSYLQRVGKSTRLRSTPGGRSMLAWKSSGLRV